MFTTLLNILKAHPHGIKEYELLKQLENLQMIESTPAHMKKNNLDLFQRHFLLFHSLYKLRDYLLIYQCYHLEIHCLNIRLWPYYNPKTTLPAVYEPLRDYYLDLNNLENTSKNDVDDLLNQFWQRYEHQERYRDNKEAALQVLGLDHQADAIIIKKRLGQLRSQHHPDHGGNADCFYKIEQAGKTLLNIYK
ncbi:DNA-J related domain-containing protein [Piscirickettsia litoralis]|uniref:DnaJ-related protein N-terminal domain-containing protein n=1 Tax=Piscirickettsia litoralis TaxID=1891921 RepID=A0ABX3A0I1_9GAMM|nr:DNA-J related domain-containing protein [Piscirickettsia litoralis]ODN42129.1 hypothetical protein BGC07_03175 [Piscirickettsia litoralis]